MVLYELGASTALALGDFALLSWLNAPAWYRFAHLVLPFSSAVARLHVMHRTPSSA
jgi:hypothetical protein